MGAENERSITKGESNEILLCSLWYLWHDREQKRETNLIYKLLF